MADLTLVQGHTGVIDETLKANGVVVDLTGMTVELVLQTANGGLLPTGGNVIVPTPAAGLVRYTPDAQDLLAQDTPHVARWKVTDGLGGVVFFPIRGRRRLGGAAAGADGAPGQCPADAGGA